MSPYGRSRQGWARGNDSIKTHYFSPATFGWSACRKWLHPGDDHVVTKVPPKKDRCVECAQKAGV